MRKKIAMKGFNKKIDGHLEKKISMRDYSHLNLSSQQVRARAVSLVSEYRRWFLLASEKGDAEAQYKVGKFLYLGKGVEESHSKAREFWSKAAEQGHKKAIKYLKR